MKHIKYILLLVPFIAAISCKKDYVVPTSSVINMSGEWWVALFVDDSTMIADYSDIGESIITSNTAADVNSEVLIDDQEGIWPVKIKAPVDYANLTFSPSTGNINLYDSTETVDVIAGKVLKNAATAPSGHITDSIVLQLEFSTDPGTIYWFKGYKNTGWPEDRWD